jgi:hypothetical protein
LREGILFAPGALFSNAARFYHCLRINCGWPYSAQIATPPCVHWANAWPRRPRQPAQRKPLRTGP